MLAGNSWCVLSLLSTYMQSFYLFVHFEEANKAINRTVNGHKQVALTRTCFSLTRCLTSLVGLARAP